MEITKIQYKENHVRVEVDHSVLFMLSYASITEFKLESGRIIDDDEHERLRTASQRYLCWQRSLNYLAVRNRSSMEMETYLKKKEFPSDTIEECIERLSEAGYIDDLDFAVRYIDSKLRRKAIGKNLLKRELMLKGIRGETLARAMEESSVDEVDMERLFDLALKKYNSFRGKDKILYRVSNFLYQRGFEREEINRTISRLRELEKEDDNYFS